MLELLCGLCMSNNLVVFDFETGIEGVTSKIAVPNEGNKHQEYYLLFDSKRGDEPFLKELVDSHAERFMDELDESESTDVSFRKNCTLIFCCDSEVISNKALLVFEENPYFFKKNVVVYARSELNSLKEEMGDDFSNENINRLLMAERGDAFELFKTLSLEDGSYYSLLIRIITKLPFVHYLPQSNQLVELEAFVRNELDESELKLLDFICDSEEPLSLNDMDSKVSKDWSEL